MPIDDNELLRLMQHGDTGALGMLYVRYSSHVKAFARGFMQNDGDADDITHDVFVSLWQHRDTVSDITSLKAYLFRMTRNAIFSTYRHRSLAEAYISRLKDNFSEESTETEDKISTDNLLELVNIAINTMPEQRKNIFIMNRFDNKTYDEIAAELGISRKTVEYHISHALSQLRKLSRLMNMIL